MGRLTIRHSIEAAAPGYVERWFAGKGWTLRPYQRRMIEAFRERQSTLLIAPTGGGKTLSGFLPSLIEIHDRKPSGLHTLYISPLKALANDIERNLHAPITEMGLDVSVESRTGDTPQSKRKRQRERPPHILLTTPESIMLMLSFADAGRLFANLRSVIVDEVHSFAHSKRGDFTALALARLGQAAPDHVRFGLSATAAHPEHLAEWLCADGHPVALLKAGLAIKPNVKIMKVKRQMPYGGFMAQCAVPDIYEAIKRSRTCIVFVNTRAQAELLMQMLWEVNEASLPITVYHGSLNREQRRRTEAMMAAGKLRAVVATAALELGIDWGDVDLVIQVGAPKGVSRLLQRIGRSNHRMDEPSEALLVPANRFECLEARAALAAIAKGALDGDGPMPGSQDVIIQYVINCACSQPIDPDALFAEVRSALPYRDLPRDQFDALFRFAIDGGNVLANYERYRRLIPIADGRFTVASNAVRRRHRMNIGVIVEAARLKVMRLNKTGKTGRILGEIEEYFAQGLTTGDTFIFAGELLAFVRIRDLTIEARPAAGGQPKIPSYEGGQMPLSTFLADGVRQVLSTPTMWRRLPREVREWLTLQQSFSIIPPDDALLIEHFPQGQLRHTVFYTFEGRRANQTLGLLVTRRMERLGLHPVSFTVTDYGLSIANLQEVGEDMAKGLLSPDILGDDLEEWIMDAAMLRRSFRHVATVAGLVGQQHIGAPRVTARQLTVSSNLIYDVLRRHEPDHVLLTVARRDAERELLDLKRLSDMLRRFSGQLIFRALEMASPLAIPVMTEVRTEQVRGAGVEVLLAQANMALRAEAMIEDVRAALA